MKKKLSSSILYLYVIPLILIVGMVVCAAVTVFYSTTTVDESGKVIRTDWPREFSSKFAHYIIREKQSISISEEGIKQLEKYHLWAQILDEEGNELLEVNAPSGTAKHYAPYELLSLFQNGTKDYSTIIKKIEDTNQVFIIGFPMHISKVVMYIDTLRYNAGKTSILFILLFTFGMTVIITILYSFILSKHLGRIRKSLVQISRRTYTPIKSKRFLHEIYEGINQLDADIQATDQIRQQNEQARDEWIANITHDLKTPLAPIKGYAEILSESKENLPQQKVNEYGEIIGKNAGYAEQLINDMKLIYQLKNGMLPMKKELQDMNRFLKETVIDLLNHPEFSERRIDFTPNAFPIATEFDTHLMKRAFNNVIGNAMVHNTADTTITITISADTRIRIKIADNGCGMTKEEVNKLFNRYYRGSNTKTKSEGTGLGMAISKQIIELHEGTMEAKSQQSVGTEVMITLPYVD